MDKRWQALEVGEDYTIRLWDAVTGEHKETLTGHTDRVNNVVFSSDGRNVGK